MNSFAKAFSKLGQVGITVVVTIGMCFFIGKWLDTKFNTQPIFLIIFILLGIGASFRNLYMLLMLDYKKEQQKEEQQRNLIYQNVNKNINKQKEKKEETSDF